MSSNTVLHHRTKHIDVRVYHLLDLCRAGLMILLKLGTNEMTAHVLTKALPSFPFEKHRSTMLNEREGTHFVRE
eukprot:1446621-Rhodomonas_salina.1